MASLVVREVRAGGTVQLVQLAQVEKQSSDEDGSKAMKMSFDVYA